MACEILAGALTGGITLHARPDPNAIINNMLSFIVDPDRLGTAARLTHEARAFADWVKASPPRDGQSVLLPGDPERACRKDRSANGIAIDETTFGQLLQAAVKVGLDTGAMKAVLQG